MIEMSIGSVERARLLIGDYNTNGEARALYYGKVHCDDNHVHVHIPWLVIWRRWYRYGDVIGTFHTHPRPYPALPSAEDRRTMHALVVGLGRPLICIIQSGRRYSATLFYKKSSRLLAVRKVRNGWVYSLRRLDGEEIRRQKAWLCYEV